MDGIASGVEVASGSAATSVDAVGWGSKVASESSVIADVETLASSALAAGATSAPKTNVKNVNKLAIFFIETPHTYDSTDAVLSQQKGHIASI